jgi:outer membrane lipoprotein SlyB
MKSTSSMPMRQARITTGVAVILSLLAAAGCESGGQGALSGAAIGSLGGLAIGSLTGSAGAGAAIGAVGGAVAGGVIGDQNRRAKEEQQNMRYSGGGQ